jgi:hypothetical protein
MWAQRTLRSLVGAKMPPGHTTTRPKRTLCSPATPADQKSTSRYKTSTASVHLPNAHEINHWALSISR